jgi:hypothetical protein
VLDASPRYITSGRCRKYERQAVTSGEEQDYYSGEIGKFAGQLNDRQVMVRWAPRLLPGRGVAGAPFRTIRAKRPERLSGYGPPTNKSLRAAFVWSAR